MLLRENRRQKVSVFWVVSLLEIVRLSNKRHISYGVYAGKLGRVKEYCYLYGVTLSSKKSSPYTLRAVRKRKGSKMKITLNSLAIGHMSGEDASELAQCLEIASLDYGEAENRNGS